VPVVGAAFLIAVGRADARIHVEHNPLRRSPVMNSVDPLAGEISKRRQVLIRRQPACLETPHLARRGRRSRCGLATDEPAHRRIMTEALSVVDILVTGKPPEYRLPQQTDQFMAAVLAGAGIGERLPGNHRQAEGVVEFPVRQQSGVGGDPRAMELKL